MNTTRTFLDTKPSYGEDGVSIHCVGELIITLITDFDGEDNRAYDHSFRCSYEDYKGAIEKLQKEGHASLTSSRPPGWMSFVRRDERVEISIISDVLVGSTPGGTPVYGRARFVVDLKNLISEEV